MNKGNYARDRKSKVFRRRQSFLAKGKVTKFKSRSLTHVFKNKTKKNLDKGGRTKKKKKIINTLLKT